MVPDTAVIDFLVAISVLPMAPFTTISVLGGAHDMPGWMRGQESGLENLHLDLLEGPGDSGGDEVVDPGGSALPEAERDVEEEAEEDDSSRMIDLPFRLFED